MKLSFRAFGLAALMLGALMLQGCSSNPLEDALPDQRLAYKKQREAGENLEIPPDLVGSRFDDALDIPSPEGAPTTYSEYSGQRARRTQQVDTANAPVLPSAPNIELRRRGDERWLEVRATPQQTWPRLIAFWREQGILLVEQDPTVGVMRTDWLDNRAEIRRDFVTRMLSKVAEGLYATSTRDQYILRIERSLTPGATDIHLTHRGMEEHLNSSAMTGVSQTVWEPSGTDTEKEAEMLRRLMVYLGASQQQATRIAAAPRDQTAQSASRARLIDQDGAPQLALEQEYRRAWRLVGSALDRAGFAVEDRNQSAGIYYVRYAGDENPRTVEEQQGGWASKLAFWRKSDEQSGRVRQYQIRIVGDDDRSRISIQDAEGKPDGSPEARRILTLLQEQMR